MFLFILCIIGCFMQCQSIDEVPEFQELLAQEKNLLVLFTEECCSCTSCVEAETLLGAMSVIFEDSFNLKLVRLRDKSLRKPYGVKFTPTLVFIRENKPALYDGKFDKELVYSWIEENREPLVKELDDGSFEHLTQAATGATTGDWLVVFYKNSCVQNTGIFAHLEGAGTLLKQKVNIAAVDVEKSLDTASRFKIKQCPEVIFFRHNKMYRFNLPDITLRTLKSFVEGFYKHSKTENVPVPISNFDKLIDKIVVYLKLYGSYIFFAVSVLIFVIIVAFECFAKAKTSGQKSKLSKKAN